MADDTFRTTPAAPMITDRTMRLDRLAGLARTTHQLVGVFEQARTDPVIQIHGPTAIRLENARLALCEAFAEVAAATLAARYDLEAQAS